MPMSAIRDLCGGCDGRVGVKQVGEPFTHEPVEAAKLAHELERGGVDLLIGRLLIGIE